MPGVPEPGSPDIDRAAGPVTVDRSVPGTALAIYAHPDDPEVSCAGTLAAWAAAGCEVHLVICTRGEKGTRDPAVIPAELAATRAQESERAAEVMGLASHEMLGFPDGELENTTHLRELLVERIRRVQPEVVMGPDPTAVFFGTSYVNHHDHRAIGFALLDACAPASASPLYFPDAGPAHAVPRIFLSGTLEPDTWIDIETTVDTKVAALLCHRTQLGDEAELAGEVVRHRAAAAGRTAGLRSAEAFRTFRLG
jgi:LmbE family N-acetylglucosaminyl deacetylase